MFLKSFLPDRVFSLRVLFGPFRGAIIQASPRHSLRKVFGIYEHELNGWLTEVLPRVARVLDVGANDGYFTFGCAAAFHRLRKSGEIISFEPEREAFSHLNASLSKQTKNHIKITLNNCSVGSHKRSGLTTLDTVARPDAEASEHTLIKIDVEGAELDVIAGASQWIKASNYFIIEVHEASFLRTLVEDFLARGLKLKQIDQQPLPILGYETRSRENWWLVSELTT